ncbi:MAG: GNAT family N-acetyltransferase [Tepidisphaeraceae bacterium]
MNSGYNRAMPLPVIQGSHALSSSDLIRLFHQTELDWSRHLGEEAQLDVGTAIVNSQLPRVWDANRVLDAALPDGVSPPQAFDIAREHFAQCNSECRNWLMNPSAEPARTAPLAEHLLSRGFTAHDSDIMYLRHPPATIRETGGLTIIPARASFRHMRQLADEASKRRQEPTLADAVMMHLDDPHWDALIALKEGQAVATIGVLAVGEIGRIEDVFVTEPLRRQGIGKTMMSRALEICARAVFKHVFISPASDNVPAVGLYRACGFETIGLFTVYVAPDAPRE